MKSKQPKTNMKKFSFIWLGLCQQDETEKQDVNPKILPSTSEKNKLNSNSMSKSKSNNLKKIRRKSEKIRENSEKGQITVKEYHAVIFKKNTIHYVKKYGQN